MGINFPPNPTFPNPPNVGDTWPSPPTAGLPVYRWDGEKWTTTGAGPGKVPIYTDGTTAMTAQLKLIAPPIAPEDAAAKSYVDSLAIGTLLYGGGLQINGSMEVSQELGTAGRTLVNGAGAFACDAVGAVYVGSGVFSVAQVAITSLAGFPYCAGVTCSTVNSTGATDGMWIYQSVEGNRFARMAWGTGAAKSLTIGFWVNPHVAGTMTVSARGSSPSRSYVVDVPVTAGAWQYKTVAIPGDTAGTWATNNAAAVTFGFSFGAGNNRRAPSTGTWVTGDYIGSAATTHFFGTTGSIYLTGLVILPGTQAPTAAQSSVIMRPYDMELVICQRYFQKYPSILFSNNHHINGGTIFHTFLIPPMRAPPTISFGNVSYANASGLAQNTNLTGSVMLKAVITTAGYGYAMFDMTLDARI